MYLILLNVKLYLQPIHIVDSKEYKPKIFSLKVENYAIIITPRKTKWNLSGCTSKSHLKKRGGNKAFCYL
jgi:hypothetical protein